MISTHTIRSKGTHTEIGRIYEVFSIPECGKRLYYVGYSPMMAEYVKDVQSPGRHLVH